MSELGFAFDKWEKASFYTVRVLPYLQACVEVLAGWFCIRSSINTLRKYVPEGT